MEGVRRRRTPRDRHVHVHGERADHAAAVRAAVSAADRELAGLGTSLRFALPTASAVVAPSPTEGEATPPANAAGTSDVLFPIIAAVVIVAVLGGYLFMRRRPAQP